jgi:TM2 domain-containing membrane protein YozV
VIAPGSVREDFVILLLLIGLIAAAVMAYRSSQEETREARTIRSLPPSVQHVVAQMDGGSQAAFFNEYERKKKKKSIGWLLWFFFGFHYLYVGKVGLQFAYWFTLGGVWVWTIFDFFRMPSIIRAANDQMAREALQTLHIGAAFGRQSGAPQAMAGYQSQPAQFGNPPSQAALPSSAGSWAPDPYGRFEMRYYDGSQWTDHVSSGGSRQSDPAR